VARLSALRTRRTFLPRNIIMFTFVVLISVGARGSVVVKALCYKPGGRGFDTP
jgi:hypothetical protein